MDDNVITNFTLQVVHIISYHEISASRNKWTSSSRKYSESGHKRSSTYVTRVASDGVDSGGSKVTVCRSRSSWNEFYCVWRENVKLNIRICLRRNLESGTLMCGLVIFGLLCLCVHKRIGGTEVWPFACFMSETTWRISTKCVTRVVNKL